MTVRVNKSSFNIREKLSELGRKFGLKGSELAAAETVQEARDLVSAGRKNLIINGDVRIAQRATSATAVNDTYNTVDRFNTWINYSSGTHLMSQESDAPPGFSKSVKYTSSATTAQYHIFQQNIEANNLGHINAGTSDALPLTMSFWVKSNRPATYNFEMINDSGSHHIVKQYNIDQSGVWEHKVIHIPPQTVGGAMTVDNTSGYSLYWWLGGNSGYSGTALTDKWESYLTNRRNEGGNVTLDSGDYWMITGIQLEVGRNATDFEHRSYAEELELCQRYYQKKNIGYGRVAHFRTDALLVFAADLPVDLRASAVSITQNSGLNNWAYRDGVSPTISSLNNSTSATNNTLTVMYNVSSGGDSDETCFYYGGGSILIDAEL